MGVVFLGIAVAIVLASTELAIRSAFLSMAAARLAQMQPPRWATSREFLGMRGETRARRARAGHL
jgi:hypothetical protein